MQISGWDVSRLCNLTPLPLRQVEMGNNITVHNVSHLVRACFETVRQRGPVDANTGVHLVPLPPGRGLSSTEASKEAAVSFVYGN